MSSEKQLARQVRTKKNVHFFTSASKRASLEQLYKYKSGTDNEKSGIANNAAGKPGKFS